MVSPILLSFLIASNDGQSYQPSAVPPVWTKISSEFGVVKTTENHVISVAVVINDKGLMLTAPGPNAPDKVIILLSGPLVLTASKVGYDQVTGLAAYAPMSWPGNRAFANVATTSINVGDIVVAATQSGPVNGQAVGAPRAAQLNSSNRFVPVTELHFERTFDRIGGAALFNSGGELVGLLGATLGDEASMQVQRIPLRGGSPSGVAGGFGGGGAATRPKDEGGGAKSSPKKATDNAEVATKMSGQYGPQGFTTAYALGVNVLDRVVTGFLSPDHTVHHPTLGFKFHDEQGVIVTSVTAGQGAAQGGLKKGDRIISLNGTMITSSVNLASLLFGLDIGSTANLTVGRDGKRVELKVAVEG